jgi:hypothetical protein
LEEVDLWGYPVLLFHVFHPINPMHLSTTSASLTPVTLVWALMFGGQGEEYPQSRRFGSATQLKGRPDL